MTSKLTFEKLRKLLGFCLGVKLKRNIEWSWQKVPDKQTERGKWSYVWHLHANMIPADKRAYQPISTSLEISCCKLPKRLSEQEIKQLFVQKWLEQEVAYQYMHFSGDEADFVVRNKHSLLKSMSPAAYEDVLFEARAKDKFKTLKELDGLTESEIALKLAILGIS